MLTKRLNRTRPDDIIVDIVGLRGIGALHRKLANRAPEKCCRGTIPGYTQFIVGHDGSNLLFGERRGWVTHVAHQPRLDACQQYVEGDTFIFTVRPDDQITRMTLGQFELSTPGMDEPVLGLWQLIAFHRPGYRGEMCLPRLLLPLAIPYTKSPLH